MDIIYSFGDTFYRSSPRDYEKFPIETQNKSAQGKDNKLYYAFKYYCYFETEFSYL